MIADQIVASSSPIEVAARMIGSDAPVVPAWHEADEHQAKRYRAHDEARQLQDARVAGQRASSGFCGGGDQTGVPGQA